MSLLGERLKQEREAKAIALIQAEIDTRIRAAVLQAMEDGDYAHLPPEPFLRGLVRSYANYLRADAEDVLYLLSIDLLTPPSKAPPTSTLAKKYAPSFPPVTIDPEYLADSPFDPVSIEPETAEPTGAEMPAPADRAPSPVSLAQLETLLKRIQVPMPVMISIGVVFAFICVLCMAIVFAQVSASVISVSASRGTSTATRVPPTNTPTIAPGAAPTEIPKLALTAAPFPTFPGNPSATPKAIARRTLEIQTGLNLDIDANQSVKVLVGVDNIPLFNGTMDPGTSRSWSAKEALYVRVENAIGANIYFNGKELLAQNFAERSVMERRWALEKGTPIRTAPITPVFPTATRSVTPTPIMTITPIAFDSTPRPGVTSSP